MRRRSGLAPLWPLMPTLIVNWLVFTQVLTAPAVVLWVVLPSLAQIVLVRGIARTGLVWLAFLLGALMTPFWAVTADLLGGVYAGPVARSALLASGLTLAGLAMLTTRLPGLVLLPAVGLLAGALGLGAAGRAEVLVGLWVWAGIMTLLMLGPYRREDLRGRGRLIPLLRAIALSGAIAILGTGIAAATLGPPVLSAQLLPEMIIDPLAQAGRLAFLDAIYAGALTLLQQFIGPEITGGQSLAWVETTRTLILIAVGSALAIPLIRRGYAWLEWRILRDRLATGDPRERALGAWTWIRLRRERREDPLPVWASPDVVLSYATDLGDADLAGVAELANRLAYDPTAEATEEEAAEAWATALSLDTLEDEVTLAQVWRWSSRRPGRLPTGQRLALMPGQP